MGSTFVRAALAGLAVMLTGTPAPAGAEPIVGIDLVFQRVPDDGLRPHHRTDAQGQASFTAIPPGDYVLHIDRLPSPAFPFDPRKAGTTVVTVTVNGKEAVQRKFPGTGARDIAIGFRIPATAAPGADVDFRVERDLQGGPAVNGNPG